MIPPVTATLLAIERNTEAGWFIILRPSGPSPATTGMNLTLAVRFNVRRPSQTRTGQGTKGQWLDYSDPVSDDSEQQGDGAVDPIAGFAARLREYKIRAGNPSVRDLERLTREMGRPYPRTTIDDKLVGRSRADWEFVRTFVRACARHAGVPDAMVELDGWRTAHRQMETALARMRTGQRRASDAAKALASVHETADFAAVRRAYLNLLRERYRRVDLEILTPLTDQDEHPPVELQEVFVAQAVRADPPPMELPRELWRRLVDAGELSINDLPEGIDRELLSRIQTTYQERPAQPVLQLLAAANQPRLVLLGDPGAGKSTLARYLTLVLADEDPLGPMAALHGWLPLLVELRTYADSRWRSSTFLDLLDHLHATEGIGLPKDMAETLLRESGQVVVIFDGLDELFDPQLRETVARQIAGFAAQYPRVRIVVTSRVIGYKREVLDVAGFSHHMLQDLDLVQIESFVRKWYENACPEDSVEATRLSDRLLAAIHDSAAVRELAGNPMLLTILSIIGRRRELPRDRRAVYQHAVSVLVEHWDPSKHLRDMRVDQGMPYIDHDDKQELLRLVARRMQDGSSGIAGNHVPGLDLLAEFDDYFRKRYELPPDRAKTAAKAMLGQFRERNFVLSRFGAEVYGFVHRAFLEYLAATDVVHRFNEEQVLSKDQLISEVFGAHWADPAWQEVLLLIVGMINERFSGEVIDYLLIADPLWFTVPAGTPRHALLAVRCMGEVRKIGIISRQIRAVAEALITLLEIANDRELREPNILIQSDISQAVLPVLSVIGPRWAGRDRYLSWYMTQGQFLASPSWLSGESILSLATRICSILSVDRCTIRDFFHAQAGHSTIVGMRSAALRALANDWREDAGTLILLRERAASDPSEDVRATALQALAVGWSNDPETLTLLREHATNDPGRNARLDALRALIGGSRQAPETGNILRERAAHDLDEEIRSTALQALADGWSTDPETADLLRKHATTDRNEFTRAVALKALAVGWPDDVETMVLLRECSTTDSDGNVRATALQSLAVDWSTHPETFALLRDRASADPNWDARLAALRALADGWHDEAEVLALLRERAVGDPDEDVRSAALKALADHWPEDSETMALLHEHAASDTDSRTRTIALQALIDGWHDAPETTALLRHRATADPSTSVRSTTLLALARDWRGDPKTVALLHDRATKDEHPFSRATALQALADGWPEDGETVVLFCERATNDPSARVRLPALQALARHWREYPGTNEVLLGRAAADSDKNVRSAALRALAAGWAGDPKTLALLHDRATKDTHQATRSVALQALSSGWAGDPQTLALLHDRAANDPSQDARSFTLQLLAIGWPIPETVALLHDRAIADPHRAPRSNALRILAGSWHHAPETINLLRDRAVTDLDEEVRSAALRVLAVDSHADPATVTFLRQRATADPHRITRSAALQVLTAGGRQTQGVAAFLCECVAADPAWTVRSTALQALAADGSDYPETMALLRSSATSDPHGSTRLAALEALADSWSENSEIMTIIRDRATMDQDEGVRSAALGILADIWSDDPETKSLVQERATTDPHRTARAAALEALANNWRDDPEIMALLLDRAITDQDWLVRSSALDALVVNWPDDVKTLALLRDRAVTDPDANTRSTALQTLVRRPINQETMVLLRDRATNDANNDIRIMAEQGLANSQPEFPDDADTPPEDLFADPRWNRRLGVLRPWTDVWRRTSGTAALLRERAISDPNDAVRSTALEALANNWTEDPESLALLRERVAVDPSDAVRSTALRALAENWPEEA